MKPYDPDLDRCVWLQTREIDGHAGLEVSVRSYDGNPWRIQIRKKWKGEFYPLNRISPSTAEALADLLKEAARVARTWPDPPRRSAQRSGSP